MTAEGAAGLIVGSGEAELARWQSRLRDMRPYDQFGQNPMHLLADLLREFGVGVGPVAIEMDYLPAQDYLTLREKLAGLGMVPCRDRCRRARMVKTGEEVAWLRRIAEISDRAEQVAGRHRIPPAQSLRIMETEQAAAEATEAAGGSRGGRGGAPGAAHARVRGGIPGRGRRGGAGRRAGSRHGPRRRLRVDLGEP